MSATKKPRSDSVLKNLPEERQMAIFDYSHDHSEAETVAWLRADGVRTSTGSLSVFLSWFRLRLDLRKNEATINEVLAEMAAEDPGLSEDQLFKTGQRFFSALAIRTGEAGDWTSAQSAMADRERLALEHRKAEQRDREIELKRRMVATREQALRMKVVEGFLQWCNDHRARDAALSPGTHAEKMERLGQLIFGEDWEQAQAVPGPNAPGGAEA